MIRTVPSSAFFIMRTISYFLIGIIVLLACGCGFKQQPPVVRYYILDYTAPDPIDAAPLPVSIHVKRLQTQAPYDSRRIVYAENAFQRTTYSYHQWMANPADMITGLIVRDLRTTDFAKTIVTGTPGSRVDHIIEGTIEEFYENDTTPDWQAVLSLSFTLIRTGDDTLRETVLFQKTYRRIEPMERNNPVSLARGMSKAMQTISARFMKDAYDQIASSRPPAEPGYDGFESPAGKSQ